MHARAGRSGEISNLGRPPDAFQNEDYADFNAPDYAWRILGIVLNCVRARRTCWGLGVAKDHHLAIAALAPQLCGLKIGPTQGHPILSAQNQCILR